LTCPCNTRRVTTVPPPSVVRSRPGRHVAAVTWGFADSGERVLLSVMLGMRESYEG